MRYKGYALLVWAVGIWFVAYIAPNGATAFVMGFVWGIIWCSLFRRAFML